MRGAGTRWELSGAPFRPPKMLSRYTRVGRNWVTRARRECGPAIYRLPVRTPQFILPSRRDRQVVDELTFPIGLAEKYTHTPIHIYGPRKTFQLFPIVAPSYWQFIVAIAPLVRRSLKVNKNRQSVQRKSLFR